MQKVGLPPTAGRYEQLARGMVHDSISPICEEVSVHRIVVGSAGSGEGTIGGSTVGEGGGMVGRGGCVSGMAGDAVRAQPASSVAILQRIDK